MRKDLSISEIAKLAGVSKTTVSRVINNKSEVKPETRKIVESIIEKYDYYPNARAQMFSYQRTKAIGLVFPENEVKILSNPYYAELIQGILDKARELGYHITLTYLQHDDCFALVRSRSVDGLLLLTPGGKDSQKIDELRALGLPVVSTARVPGLKTLPHVAVDEYSATFQIVNYLIGLGHKTIAIINGPKDLFSTTQRLEGYRDALEKAGIKVNPELVLYGNTSVASGTDKMNELLDRELGVTAVFTGSDLMAVGASKAIQARGLNVPDDISLASSDGTDFMSFLDLPPTTFRQPTRQRGSIATEMLIDLIEGRETETQVLIPMEIEFHQTIKESHAAQ